MRLEQPREVHRELEDQAFVVVGEVDLHLRGNHLALMPVDHPGDKFPEVERRDVGNLLQVDQRDNFHNQEVVGVYTPNGVVVPPLEVDHNIRLEVDLSKEVNNMKPYETFEFI